MSGAGPAGSALARLLAEKYSVLLLDRRRLDLPFCEGMPGKCCGGLLAPDAQKALAACDLALPEAVLGGPQIFAVRAVDLDSGREQMYQRFYLNMDREAFDRWLVQLALSAGAEARFGAEFLSFVDGAVRYRYEGRIAEASCRTLIAADGAAGRIRRQYCGAPRPDGMYVAIQEELDAGADQKHFNAFFSAAESDFYAWSIPKRDSILLGGAFPMRDAPAHFSALKTILYGRGMCSGSVKHRCGALLARPRRNADLWYGAGKIFAVGEAAGFVSPSSAEGFSYAFRSAGILAELLLRNPDAGTAKYVAAAAPLRNDLRLKTLKSRIMYNSFMRNVIMRTGFGAL